MFMIESREWAYKNVVRKNIIYQNRLGVHYPCNLCLYCTGFQRNFQDVEFFNSEFPLMLAQAGMDSPEALAFSTKYVQESTCQCSSYFVSSSKISLSVKIPTIKVPISFSAFLANTLNTQPVLSCIRHNCSQNQVTTKAILKGSLANLLFRLEWESTDLNSLLNFLLALNTELNLNPLFGTNQTVYLQGMVLTSTQKSIYVQINPCTVFSDFQTDLSIYLDYLCFFILQYSLFPTLLVYSTVNNEAHEFQSKIQTYEESLKTYKKFLCGENKSSEGICFFCWNPSHEYCSEIVLRTCWTCYCGYENPKNTLFCHRCESPQRLRAQGDPEACTLCLSPIASTYCKQCFVIGSCSSCQRNIYKTQSVGCSDCRAWLEDHSCPICQRSVNSLPIQCQLCMVQNFPIKGNCIHSIGKDCLNCFYDFNCGLCWKPKFVYDCKFCWKCKNMLLDGICLTCKFFPSNHSIVCFDCVNSTKKCIKGHIITKQAQFECLNCQNAGPAFCQHCEQKHNDCANREFCAECQVDLANLSKTCIYCLFFAAPHKCKDFFVCQFCLPVLNTCKCGCKSLSSLQNCFACSRLTIRVNRVPGHIPVLENSDLECPSCDFLNYKSAQFCENCNSSLKPAYSDKSICPMCNSSRSSKFCEACYKFYNCALCHKDLLVGQNIHCGYCNSKTKNRVCKTCETIVPLSKLICYPCTQFNWLCRCQNLNSNSSGLCEKCHNPRISYCEICKSPAVLSNDSWRFAEKTLNRIVNDVFCCRNCSSELRVCVCGCRALYSETICKNCERVLG